MKGWTKFKDEFTDVFRGLTQLGYSVWFISHSKETQVDDGTGSSQMMIRPSLSNSVRALVEGIADIIGYAHQKKGEQMSVLTLRSPDDSVVCGGRFKYIAPEIPFTYDNLVNAVREAIDKEAAEHDNKFVTDEKVEIKAEVPTYDFPALMKEFQEIVGNLITANQSNASKITNIVEQYLGKGRKVNDCTAQQSEQIDLIVHDLKELMEKGA